MEMVIVRVCFTQMLEYKKPTADASFSAKLLFQLLANDKEYTALECSVIGPVGLFGDSSGLIVKPPDDPACLRLSPDFNKKAVQYLYERQYLAKSGVSRIEDAMPIDYKISVPANTV